MRYPYPHSLSLSLVALLAAGCDLSAVEVGGGFRDGNEESGAPEEGTGDASSDTGTNDPVASCDPLQQDCARGAQ